MSEKKFEQDHEVKRWWTHTISAEDRIFRRQFEKCKIAPSDFSHESHLRIAYIYLCENDPDIAYAKMRESLLRFLSVHGIDPQKYHETLTRAWVMAVHYFMSRSPNVCSSSDFVAKNPVLSNSEIMLTHYSKEKLFAESARETFQEPDLEPIPRPRSERS